MGKRKKMEVNDQGGRSRKFEEKQGSRRAGSGNSEERSSSQTRILQCVIHNACAFYAEGSWLTSLERFRYQTDEEEGLTMRKSKEM